jgi:hypothetical protein
MTVSPNKMLSVTILALFYVQASPFIVTLKKIPAVPKILLHEQ